ncbi:MAG: hypothetical protein D6775_02935 [Caldilineae bacterium]|nr:MAG: hypothetical protein D6775_02935 [Caldilineae bacterium]
MVAQEGRLSIAIPPRLLLVSHACRCLLLGGQVGHKGQFGGDVIGQKALHGQPLLGVEGCHLGRPRPGKAPLRIPVARFVRIHPGAGRTDEEPPVNRRQIAISAPHCCERLGFLG